MGGGVEMEKELGPGMFFTAFIFLFCPKNVLVRGERVTCITALLVRTAFSVRGSGRTVIPQHLAL